jgi:hypothetical protein
VITYYFSSKYNPVKKLLLFGLLICNGFVLFASHIIGGDMSYVYTGNDNYHVTLHVYRDCFNGQAPFDNPAYLFAFNTAGNLVQQYTAALGADDTLPLVLGCADTVPGLCAEQGTYEFDISLPPVAGGYTLVYQRCCRSYTILNVFDPSNQGMTIIATIPDMNAATGNNSPVFNSYPPLAFCIFSQIDIDQSATDADGDSLAYELATAIAGSELAYPQPIPPLPPPYPDIIYASPYSAVSPFDANPPFAINPVTGFLSGTPTTFGIFAIAYRVKEYRGGFMLGTYQREMTIYNVADVATGNVDPQLSSITIFPVPAADELNISIPSSLDVHGFTIYNSYGQVVHFENFSGAKNSFTLSLSKLPDGIYYTGFVTPEAVITRSFEVKR